MSYSTKAQGPIILSRDFTVDQTELGYVCRTGSATDAFSVIGYGQPTALTQRVIFNIGGFTNQYTQQVMRYVTPTTAGTELLVAFLRFQSSEATVTSYEARLTAQVAEISKLVAGSRTQLASGAFALPQNTAMTITFQAVGSQLNALFTASGVTTAALAATDTAIPTGGMIGYTSTSAASLASHLSMQL